MAQVSLARERVPAGRNLAVVVHGNGCHLKSSSRGQPDQTGLQEEVIFGNRLGRQLKPGTRHDAPLCAVWWNIYVWSMSGLGWFACILFVRVFNLQALRRSLHPSQCTERVHYAQTSSVWSTETSTSCLEYKHQSSMMSVLPFTSHRLLLPGARVAQFCFRPLGNGLLDPTLLMRNHTEMLE